VRPQRCDGVDFNVGPKHNRVGGPAPAERNVIVASGCNGVEFSHGWNQALPPREDTSRPYQVNDNSVIGNYIGLRPDGSYDPAYVIAPSLTSDNDGSGVNIIDVANGNVVEGNAIASHLFGVQIFGPRTSRNVVRGNRIGVTPAGAAASIGRSGVRIRWSASAESIVDNVIAHTGTAGIEIDDPDNDSNLISRNAFDAIGSLAIDLAPLGVANPNDPSDADDGANQQLNVPVITRATATTVTGTAPPRARVELYRSGGKAGKSGPGAAYLTTVTADAAGRFTAAASLGRREMVTATATDAASDTSEFAANVRAQGSGSGAEPAWLAAARPWAP
jgi:hypothetical protein